MDQFVAETAQDNLLKQKALKGVFYLTIRKVFVQGILTTSNIILARLLFPSAFGAFAISSIIVDFFGIFTSLGLSLALIQRKKEPSVEELQASFTVNLILSLVIAVLIFLLAPFFYGFYAEQLGSGGTLYIQLLAISLIGLRLKEISVVKLQRELNYKRIVLGEILEVLAMQVTSVFLAVLGFGVVSLVFGVLVGRFFGGIVLFLLAPWPVRLKFSLKVISEILPFGMDFQISNIVGLANGAVTPIFVGKVSGAAAVGYLNWAGGLAAAPRALSDVMGQLIFPVCSRGQDSKKTLKLVIEKSIQFSCMGVFPLVAILAALAYPVTYIVYTDKWLPAVPALYFFSLQSVFIVVGVVFMQALLALGDARNYRNISIFWAALQWALTIPLVLVFGFIGLAVAGTIVSVTLFIPLVILRRKVDFKIGPHVWPYLFYSACAGSLAFLVNVWRPALGIFDLVIYALISGFFYFFLIFIFKRKEITEDVVKMRRILKGI